jgi:hypothetical protein
MAEIVPLPKNAVIALTPPKYSADDRAVSEQSEQSEQNDPALLVKRHPGTFRKT